MKELEEWKTTRSRSAPKPAKTGSTRQDNMANRLGPGRTARFAGYQHLLPIFAQSFGQAFNLSGLAGPLSALKCNKMAAQCRYR